MKNTAENCLDQIGWGKYQTLVFLCSCEAVGIGVGSSMLLPLIFTQLEGLTNANKGLLGAVLNLGLLLTAGYAGRKADKKGRITLFKKGSYVILVGLIMLAFSNSFWSLFFSFFVIGLGSGSDLAITNSLLMESIPTYSRKFLAYSSISMNIASTWIYVTALVMEYNQVQFISDWRFTCLMFAAVHTVFIYLRQFLEEGPIFLHEKGEIEEMKKVLKNVKSI